MLDVTLFLSLSLSLQSLDDILPLDGHSIEYRPM
jgi:hypothetical protein